MPVQQEHINTLRSLSVARARVLRPVCFSYLRAAAAELVTQCWAADPLLRPAFTTVMQRLESMLATLVQNEAEAHERFVSDL